MEIRKGAPVFFLALLSTCSWSSVFAYELATHGALTYESFKRSVLNQNPNDPNDPQFLSKVLGVQNGVDPFGSIYYDVSGAEIRERPVSVFEQDKGRMPDGTRPQSVEGWLMRGAIREDDVGGFGAILGDTRDIDPYGEIVRVVNHFYDPVFDRSLTLGRLVLGQTAPNWGIGTTNAFASPFLENTSRRNHFSVFDAREAMFRALTLKRKTGAGSYSDIEPSGSLTNKNAVRNAYWATTFRALGDVLHLNQDMAQPQHTRNEPHTGPAGPILGHKGVFEEYLDARATGATSYTIDGTAVQPAPLSDVFGNYAIPAFSDYVSFFSTRQIDSDLRDRRGLADYSNRGFFTPARNLGNTIYSSPSISNPIPQLGGCSYTPSRTVNARFLAGPVRDSLSNSADTIRLTSESIWSVFGVTVGTTYTLNKCNYDDMASLLIPRAVAYSAGLINYFFRGRIEADDASYTDTGISLRVKNAIDTTENPHYKSENLSTGGKLIVAYDYLPAGVTDNSRRVFGSSAPVTLTEDIKPGRSSPGLYSFTIPEIPETAVDVRFRLVYRGRLGEEEDAVAAATFEPLSGFLVVAPDGSGNRLVYRAWGKWRSSKKPDLKVGAVDWKGWYNATGRPTKVLSWKGPRSRYFPDPLLDDPRWESVIYEGGDLLADAPSGVLGAAVQRDTSGDEWLVAIVSDVGADVVYRRPYKRGGSHVLYHPVSAPDGWQELGRIPRGVVNVLENFSPWFFNGAGTEAQTVRLRVEFPGGVKTVVPMRYKVRITGANAQPETFRPEGIRYQKQCRYQLAPPFHGCESRDAYVSESATFQGSVIVAADYLDNQEVFMEISDDRLDVYNRGIAASESVEEHPVYVPPLFPSGGNFHTTNQWCRGNGTKNIDKANSGAQMMKVGSQRLVLDGSDGSNVTRAEADYLLCLGSWCGYERPNPGYASAGQRTVGTLAVQKGTVTFVDLRYSFMVAGRKIRSHEISGSGASSNSLNFAYTETTTTTEEKEFTRKIESTLGSWTLVTAPSATSNVQQSATVFGRPVSVSPDPDCANSETVSYPNPEQFLARSLGSWLVDANHEVLISQSYQDENGVSRLFNFLTDGDLVQLMPPTPPPPYYRAFVVR